MMAWAWTCHIKSPLTWLSGNDTAGIHVDNTNLHVSNISALRPSEREYALWTEELLVGNNDMRLLSRYVGNSEEPMHV